MEHIGLFNRAGSHCDRKIDSSQYMLAHARTHKQGALQKDTHKDSQGHSLDTRRDKPEHTETYIHRLAKKQHEQLETKKDT